MSYPKRIGIALVFVSLMCLSNNTAAGLSKRF